MYFLQIVENHLYNSAQIVPMKNPISFYTFAFCVLRFFTVLIIILIILIYWIELEMIKVKFRGYNDSDN